MGSYSNSTRTLIESWNGTAWSIVPSPNDGSNFNELLGVSCVSTTSCQAVGDVLDSISGDPIKTLIESWNGTAWSLVPSPSPGTSANALYGVSCVSATSCKAVGSLTNSTYRVSKTLIESWNGTAWSLVPSPSPGTRSNELYGVSCVPTTSICKAVGGFSNDTGATYTKSLIESWNGTAWSVTPSPKPGTTTNYLTGVSCVSATFCQAVGNYVFVESWNGTAWSYFSTPQPGGNGDYFGGVTCSSVTSCKAVGHYAGSTDHYKTLVESYS